MDLKLIFALMTLTHSIYDYACCADRHCHPVPCGEISRTETGWRWKEFEFNIVLFHASPDGKCHVCVGAETSTDDPTMEYPICIYLPSSV